MSTGNKGYDVREQKRTVIVEFQTEDLAVILHALAAYNGSGEAMDPLDKAESNHVTWVAKRVLRAKEALEGSKS